MLSQLQRPKITENIILYLFSAHILRLLPSAISITVFLTFAVCILDFTVRQTLINLVRINADVKHSYYHPHSIKDGLIQCYYRRAIYPDCEEDEITARGIEGQRGEIHFS